MGFRFHRRLNFGRGMGINLGSSGVSASVRGRTGSVGTRGFSLRTGIPGLSYRQRWGSGAGLALGLALALVALLPLALQLAWWLVCAVIELTRWLVLTGYDLAVYLAVYLVERTRAWRAGRIES